MPFYPDLKRDDYGAWTANRLLALRRSLRATVPQRTLRDTLLLASWNIRDFDSNKFGHGPRLNESYFYIAEILSAFDIIAVQEINQDLRALRRVMRILGPAWDFIVTDVTQGVSGNGERMAFVFDKRKVWFKNVAGQVVLPKGRGVVEREIVDANGITLKIERQFARTPFLCNFQSGWFRFSLCTVHIYFGADSGQKLQRRIKEIQAIAKDICKRATKEKSNFFVLRDFNIVSPQHKTMKALKDEGFKIPRELQDDPSNMWKNKFYDQIAFKAHEDHVRLTGKAGVFDPYNTVFTTAQASEYYRVFTTPAGETRDDYYKKTWRTFQISDHLPMWVELEIDFSDSYLRDLENGTA